MDATNQNCPLSALTLSQMYSCWEGSTVYRVFGLRKVEISSSDSCPKHNPLSWQVYSKQMTNESWKVTSSSSSLLWTYLAQPKYFTKRILGTVFSWAASENKGKRLKQHHQIPHILICMKLLSSYWALINWVISI